MIRNRFAARKAIAGIAVFAAVAPLAAVSVGVPPPPINPNFTSSRSRSSLKRRSSFSSKTAGTSSVSLCGATIGVRPAAPSVRLMGPYGHHRVGHNRLIAVLSCTRRTGPPCKSPITQYVTGASEPVIEGDGSADHRRWSPRVRQGRRPAELELQRHSCPH
jgi:hypothetical protein